MRLRSHVALADSPAHPGTSRLLSATCLAIVLGLCIAFSECAHGQDAGAPASSTAEQSAGTNRIAGRVVSGKDGASLERARVFIENVENRQQTSQSVVTGADGRFTFDGLAAGKYSLHGSKRGFMDGAYDEHGEFSTAIVTGAGLDTRNLVLRLAPVAMITARVIDEAGEPVRGARVNVFRDMNRTGQDRTVPVGGGTTDDLGVCEIPSLPAGNYFVSAVASPWYAVHPSPATSPGTATPPTFVDRKLDVAYPTTLYANATDADEATPIPVKAGDQLDVDINLSPVPGLHLLFRQPQNSGGQVAFPSLQRRTLNGFEFVQPGNIQGAGEGLFELSGLPPGKYKVQMAAPGQPARTSDLSLTTDGQELDSSAGELAGSLKAAVTLADGSKLPSQMFILLIDSGRVVVAAMQLNDKGQANFENLPPGEYMVGVQAPGKAYSVAAIVGEGSRAAGHAVKIIAGSKRTISLLVASGSARVKGFVKRGDLAVAGAMVVLVPDSPELNVELFRRDQTDLDGSFDLQSVIPGDYKLVAIENGWDLEWSRPEVISHYLPLGQKVNLPDNQNRVMDLSAPVRLQAR